MGYALRYAKEGWAAEVLMERGVPAPSWVDEEPLAESGDRFYMEAFWELSTERQLGFTVGPIPVSQIRQYPGAEGMSSAMMRLFVRVIRAMDETYREWAESERQKANKKKQPTNLGENNA